MKIKSPQQITGLKSFLQSWMCALMFKEPPFFIGLSYVILGLVLIAIYCLYKLF